MPFRSETSVIKTRLLLCIGTTQRTTFLDAASPHGKQVLYPNAALAGAIALPQTIQLLVNCYPPLYVKSVIGVSVSLELGVIQRFAHPRELLRVAIIVLACAEGLSILSEHG